MIKLSGLCLLLTGCFIPWQALAQLPDWAEDVLAAHDLDKSPEDARAWRLLDDITLTMDANGQIIQQRRIVQVVLNPRGIDDANAYIISGNEETSTIKRLKGWHRYANNVIDTLDKRSIYTVGMSSVGSLNRDTQSLALFEDVDVRSTVVFESEEIVDNLFAYEVWSVLDTMPIAKRVIRLKLGEGVSSYEPKLKAVNFDTWDLQHEISGNTITITQIPEFKNQVFAADYQDAYPYLLVGFLKKNGQDHLASWDQLATWYYEYFNQAAVAGKTGANPADEASLRAISKWIDANITYRQRYLSAARGWQPAAGDVVARRAYGDCKDLVACMAQQAKEKNIQVLPVLANINDVFQVSSDMPVANYFNHLIAAVPLDKSYGLPAEVTIDDKPYLLADPTARHTPFGYLHSAHANSNVLVCTPAGARWVAVPATACEQESINIEVTGQLDSQMTLQGTLQITELGDALGLRTLFIGGNSRDLQWAVVKQLEIPGVADLTMVRNEIDDQNRLQATYRIKWPSFMYRDAGGLRAPRAITGGLRGVLVPAGKTRIDPVGLGPLPKITWQVNLQSQVGLQPLQEKSAWEGDYHSFDWQASSGDALKFAFTYARKPLFFPKDQVANAVDYWRDYSQAYNDFWLKSTLFIVPQ